MSIGLLSGILDPIGNTLESTLKPVGDTVGTVTKPVTGVVGNVTKPVGDAIGTGQPVEGGAGTEAKGSTGKYGGKKQTADNPLGL